MICPYCYEPIIESCVSCGYYIDTVYDRNDYDHFCLLYYIIKLCSEHGFIIADTRIQLTYWFVDGNIDSRGITLKYNKSFIAERNLDYHDEEWDSIFSLFVHNNNPINYCTSNTINLYHVIDRLI